MPTAVILMELVYQLYQAGHMLAPTHSRRDDNQWADELTHPEPGSWRYCVVARQHGHPPVTFLGKGGFWIQNTSGPSLRQPVALSWEGKTRSDPFPFKARSYSGGAALGAG